MSDSIYFDNLLIVDSIHFDNLLIVDSIYFDNLLIVDSIYSDNLLSPGKLLISHFLYQADSGFEQHETVVVSNRCVNVFSRQG